MTSSLVSDCGRSRSYPRSLIPGPTSLISPYPLPPPSPEDTSFFLSFLLRRHRQQHHIPTTNNINPTTAGTPNVAILSGDIGLVDEEEEDDDESVAVAFVGPVYVAFSSAVASHAEYIDSSLSSICVPVGDGDGEGDGDGDSYIYREEEEAAGE